VSIVLALSLTTSSPGMFKDKDFQVKSAVDKRGRNLGKRKQKEDMQKYYRIPKSEVRSFDHGLNQKSTRN